MKQQQLFENVVEPQKPVNVASVPQRSVFRYPGGKTWLIPMIRKWLNSFDHSKSIFVEPFLGGGIVSLTVAFEELAKKVIACELDDEIAAVWQVLLSEENHALAKKIQGFDMNMEDLKAELAKPAEPTLQKAFQTILKNRTYHGGILARGSGLLKHGEAGKGIKSRWYPDTLAKRILDISTISRKISFVEGDAFALIRKHLNKENVIFFIDPPYTASTKKAGNRLYTHFELDHTYLFSLMRRSSGKFLMTYDDDLKVLELAKEYGMQTKRIPMKNTHHNEMFELLISNDLSWCR